VHETIGEVAIQVLVVKLLDVFTAAHAPASQRVVVQNVGDEAPLVSVKPIIPINEGQLSRRRTEVPVDVVVVVGIAAKFKQCSVHGLR